MNKSILMGRATADPTIAYTSGNDPMAIARFTLAVDRKGSEGADFIRVVAFRKTAEFCEKYVKKGAKYCIAGHIHTDKYEKDGTTVYTTDVIIDEIEFCEKKNNDNDGFIPAGIDEELPFAK